MQVDGGRELGRIRGGTTGRGLGLMGEERACDGSSKSVENRRKRGKLPSNA